jgi:hypothetical protein
MATPEQIQESARRIINYMIRRHRAPSSEHRYVIEQELLALLDKDSPTPAGSGSDSDMSPGASDSQSRESGVEPRQGEGKP